MLSTMPYAADASIQSTINGYKITKPKTKPRTTLEEKIMILNHYHKSNKPQADTVDFLKDRYSISTSSFSDWLKGEKTLRNLYNNSNESLKKSKRKLRFKYDKINEEMDKLVEERIKAKKPINEPYLRENWAVFANKYGVEDPKRLLSFSHGWLSQFKKRHGLDKQSRMLKMFNGEEDLILVTAASNDLSEEEVSTDHETKCQQQRQLEQSLNINSTMMKPIPSQSQQPGTGNFLNMEINEDYINLQTNINNFDTLLNGTKNFNNPRFTNIQQHHQQQKQPSTIVPITNGRQLNLGTQAIRPFNTTFDQLNNGSGNSYEVINEDDFEIFMSRYGEGFLGMNQDKYPESYKTLMDLKNVFKKEKEGYNDGKLRELLFRG